MLDLAIPVYPGRYDMAADALQAELTRLRDTIITTALTALQRFAVKQALERELNDYPSLAQIDAAQVATVSSRWEELAAQEPFLTHLREEFARIRAKLVREYGVQE